jgi:hypothetical protein
MSGPGKLNFASLPLKVPWPMSTTNTTSSAFTFFAMAANARWISCCVDLPVARAASFSG